MPTIPQSELPRPKSWDEFEDIVWDLYARLWEDRDAQRYGRSGQAQQGVDVYGRPARLGGGYAGIQCKRYAAGTLTRAGIEAEIVKAEAFTPPLAEYLIATTEPRNAKLQEAVREIDGARRAAGKFPVRILFWDDLSGRLKDPAHHDLLDKHYGDWLRRGFGLPVGAPFQAPPLPAHFVPRPEVSGPVKERLLAKEEAGPGVLVVSAIQGLGGIGKSVLAAALAHDPEVQARFPDGVLWATLGQRPELHSLLGDWIVNGLHDTNYRPTTLEAASAYLRTLLLEKAALLVVDDVWETEHVCPFLVGSTRCCVLITTRRADVADEVGAGLHQMDVMTPAQSLALLEARLRRPLEGEERRNAQRLARLVGHLPLALELAAVRVGRGATWVELCTALEGEVARLEALDGARRRRKRATRLEACFTLSLDALRADDAEAWEAFAWLGVLPEDATLVAPMAATLWNVDRTEAGDLLELLWNDALLLPGSPVRIDEEEVPGYRLHDLLHDIARGLLTGDPPQGLGRSLRGSHAALLERYRAQTGDGPWYTLPDDGYVHEHLAWHMEGAGWEEEIHALLAEETAGGRNGWFEARERLGQTAGYMTDLTRAWRLAEEHGADVQLELAKKPHHHHDLGLQCRYALYLASLNSLAGNIPAKLLVALVNRKRWTPLQALAYARQVPGPAERIKALAGLAPLLTGALREEALVEGLAATRSIESERRRAESLAALAPQLEGELLSQGLGVAQDIGDEWYRAHALAALAPQLTGGLRQETLVEGLAAARALGDDWERVQALAALASQLTGALREGALVEGLAAARAIGDDEGRAHALAALAPWLTGVLRKEALSEGLAAAQAIGPERWRAHALAALAPQLAGELLAEGLAAARAIGDDRWRAEALAALAPQLTGKRKEELLDEGLVAAWAIGHERWRAHALAALAPRLAGELLAEGLAVARAIGDEGSRAEALAALAPQLTGVLQEEALVEGLSAARAIGHGRWRAEALAALAPQLTGALWEKVLVEGLAAARAIGDKGSRAEALAALAPQLTGELLVEGLAAARAIGDERWCTEALAALAPQLEGELLVVGLAAARSIGDEWTRAHALAVLAPQLTGELLVAGLAIAQSIGHEGARAEALVALATELTGELLAEGLNVARSIGHERWRAHALAALAPQLTGELREDALIEGLAAARAIGDKGARARGLAALAPQLTGELREEALVEGLTAAWAIGDEWDRAHALTTLAPELAGELLAEGLNVARAIGDERVRAHALAALAPRLTGKLREDVLGEGLVAAQSIGDRTAHAEAMAALAPRLTGMVRENVLGEGLASAQAIEDGGACAEALGALAPQLTGRLLGKALAAARAIGDKWYRACTLGALAPQLTEGLREEALSEGLAAARAIGDEWERAGVLSALAPQLTGELLLEGLAAARAIGNKEWRAKALSALAPPLATLSFPALYPLWREVLHHLATRTRGDLLSDLRALTPVVVALGGEEAVAETFRAIQDVGRWWP